MRILIRSMWKAPEFWIGLTLFGFVFWGLMGLFMRAQRADFQQRINESALQTVREIRTEIAALREQERELWEQNQRSMQDRNAIHEDVKKAKEELKTVKEAIKSKGENN
jgi:hypothetical protein